MPISIQIVVQGNQRLQRTFAAWKHHARVTRPYFSLVRQDFRRIMVAQFDSAGARLGRPWAPLAEATLIDKARRGHDPRILHRTRVMRKSFTMGRGGYRYVNTHTLKLGSSVPYAGYHQSGTSKMPQRIIFEMTPEIANRWTRMFGFHITRGTAS